MVIRNDKSTTKIRMVFVASVKQNNSPSLNDCLDTGPPLMPHRFGVLIQLRAHNVMFIADIEKAFLKIALHPSDRDFVRFVWFADPDNIQLRLCTVLFGATCSSFVPNATRYTVLSFSKLCSF